MGFNTSTNASVPNGSTLNYLSGSANGMSTDLAPDFIGKLAFEPGYGHFEIKDRLPAAGRLAAAAFRCSAGS